MFFLLKECHLELISPFERRMIEGYVVLENVRTAGSSKIACHGDSGSQAPQSMHSSGWIYNWFGNVSLSAPVYS